MTQDLPAVQRAFDLAKEILPRVGKFPKGYKFSLGDRLVGGAVAGT